MSVDGVGSAVAHRLRVPQGIRRAMRALSLTQRYASARVVRVRESEPARGAAVARARVGEDRVDCAMLSNLPDSGGAELPPTRTGTPLVKATVISSSAAGQGPLNRSASLGPNSSTPRGIVRHVDTKPSGGRLPAAGGATSAPRTGLAAPVSPRAASPSALLASRSAPDETERTAREPNALRRIPAVALPAGFAGVRKLARSDTARGIPRLSPLSPVSMPASHAPVAAASSARWIRPAVTAAGLTSGVAPEAVSGDELGSTGAGLRTRSDDQESGNKPAQGDVYLDGTLMGRWMMRKLAAEAGRPASGSAGFDPRRSNFPSGAMIGG